MTLETARNMLRWWQLNENDTAVFPLRAAVEVLSAQLHAIYQQEARKQGDIWHPDDYDALPEHTKEFDRVLARFILTHACIQDVLAMIDDPLDPGVPQ